MQAAKAHMQNRRVDRTKALLIVIDIQEKLLPAISEKERVLQNSVRLIKGAGALGVPVVATEQYRKGLGNTVAEIAKAIPGFSPIEKLAFSACGAELVMSALKTAHASDVILCGIEAHVCVSQTCLDLLDAGLRVFVAADAISSRTAENRGFGIERMRQSGAVVVSTEMILFELLQCAGTDPFEQVLGLVK
jgi:nicotinamidase-related amidase